MAQNMIIVVHVPCALGKNVYSTIVGYCCILCHVHQIASFCSSLLYTYCLDFFFSVKSFIKIEPMHNLALEFVFLF